MLLFAVTLLDLVCFLVVFALKFTLMEKYLVKSAGISSEKKKKSPSTDQQPQNALKATKRAHFMPIQENRLFCSACNVVGKPLGVRIPYEKCVFL